MMMAYFFAALVGLVFLMGGIEGCQRGGRHPRWWYCSCAVLGAALILGAAWLGLP